MFLVNEKSSIVRTFHSRSLVTSWGAHRVRHHHDAKPTAAVRTASEPRLGCNWGTDQFLRCARKTDLVWQSLVQDWHSHSTLRPLATSFNNLLIFPRFPKPKPNHVLWPAIWTVIDRTQTFDAADLGHQRVGHVPSEKLMVWIGLRRGCTPECDGFVCFPTEVKGIQLLRLDNPSWNLNGNASIARLDACGYDGSRSPPPHALCRRRSFTT